MFSKDDGQEVTPKGRKARALLAYMVSNPSAKIAKARIVALLWGDRGEAQARASLRQALMELRSSLHRSKEVICTDREHIWLSPDLSVEDDPPDQTGGYKDAFEDLDGITPQFDEWLAAERTRRANAYIASLKARARELLNDARGEESLLIIEQVQAMDPHDEDALRMAMEAEFQLARPGAIVERYRTSAALLSEDLGVNPSHTTRALRDQLLRRLTSAAEPQRLPEGDREYFRRRADEERTAAASAPTESSRKIHEELAKRYDEMAAPMVDLERH